MVELVLYVLVFFLCFGLECKNKIIANFHDV